MSRSTNPFGRSTNPFDWSQQDPRALSLNPFDESDEQENEDEGDEGTIHFNAPPKPPKPPKPPQHEPRSLVEQARAVGLLSQSGSLFGSRGRGYESVEKVSSDSPPYPPDEQTCKQPQTQPQPQIETQSRSQRKTVYSPFSQIQAPSSTFSNRGWFTKPQMGQQKEQQKEQQMGQQEMGRVGVQVPSPVPPPPPLPTPDPPPPQHPSWRQQRREQRLKEQQEEQERDAADWERFGTAVSASDENAVIRFLLSEKVFGYPHTSGGVLSNYLRYCFNNHPALSVLLMHPLHPFRRRYRVVVLLCSLSFAVCMSFLLLKTSLLPVIATCHNPCDCVEEQAQQTDDAETVCVGGFNDGRSCAFYHQRCALYAPWQLSAIAGAFTVLYDALIRAAATCGCVQGRSQFQSYMGGCLKWLVEYFGGISLLLFSLLSLAMALVTLAYCWQYHVVWTTLLTMVVAELWAQVHWLAWSTPWFFWSFRADKKGFLEQQRRKAQRRGEKV